MKSFQTARILPFSAQQMFDLVADVESYPQFVPLCDALRVRSRETLADGRDLLVADMTVAYKIYRETFASRVTLDRSRWQILVEYLDGPFRRLENEWAFQPKDNGCRLDFYIAYEFRSRSLQLVVGAMFDRAFRKFADAFQRRAGELFGPQPVGSHSEGIGAAAPSPA